jgi:hypothetical protein
MARSLNATQALVLGFFVLAWLSLLAILLAAPEIYDSTLKLADRGNGAAEFAFLAGLTALLIVLGAGVLRRWRWTFWLILVAFLFGLLRVPVSLLELAGMLPPGGPPWYEALQGGIGVVQFCLGLAMLVGYRRAGTWGDFLNR